MLGWVHGAMTSIREADTRRAPWHSTRISRGCLSIPITLLHCSLRFPKSKRCFFERKSSALLPYRYMWIHRCREVYKAFKSLSFFCHILTKILAPHANANKNQRTRAIQWEWRYKITNWVKMLSTPKKTRWYRQVTWCKTTNIVFNENLISYGSTKKYANAFTSWKLYLLVTCMKKVDAANWRTNWGSNNRHKWFWNVS